MVKGGVRRALIVLLSYGLGAVVVYAGAVFVARLLVLPELFLRLLVVILAGGAVAAVWLAWIYPRLGHGGAPTDDTRREA